MTNRVEFLNGSYVHEEWPSLKDLTCIAFFQYQRDAELFARLKAQEEAERKVDQKRRFIVTNTYNAEMIVADTTRKGG